MKILNRFDVNKNLAVGDLLTFRDGPGRRKLPGELTSLKFPFPISFLRAVTQDVSKRFYYLECYLVSRVISGYFRAHFREHSLYRRRKNERSLSPVYSILRIQQEIGAYLARVIL